MILAVNLAMGFVPLTVLRLVRDFRLGVGVLGPLGAAVFGP